MSITNNNPFLINIQPIQNTATSSSGVIDPIATLRTDVTNIQHMVDFSAKTISADIITSFSGNGIQVNDNMNINNAILSIDTIPVIAGNWTINGSSNTTDYTSLSSVVSYGLSSVVSGNGVSSLS